MPIVHGPVAAIAIALCALAVSSCDKLEPNRPGDEARAAARERALVQRLQAACSSPATYDRLKQVAFEEAGRVRNSDPANLDTLATYSTVRMENPVLKSLDKALDVTVCSGRFVLDLPPGAERGFAGKRQLKADIEYAAQMAADGSGLVYQIKGAEPIIYKLAAFDLKRQSYRPPRDKAHPQLAERGPVPAVVPVSQRQTAPEPLPVPTRQARVEPLPSPRPLAPSPAPRMVDQSGSSGSSPSFNCRNARTRSERMVCSSGQLAALDRAMSSLFYSRISDADSHTRAELRRSRDRFLAFRERCSSEACVAQAYADRMAEIRDISGGR